MVNIVGPGLSGDQATSSRPTPASTGSGVDLWFKNCSSEAAQDGTRINAIWLNAMLAQLREAIRGMGVPENETDDTMLLQCFQKLQFTNWLNLPIFPEILESGNVLSLSTPAGSVRVDAGQQFLHRGWNKVDTNDYSSAARTHAHAANKTYHLRWQYNGGSPLFALKDLADVVYNPTAAAETNAGFDSTFDDMLIARVVTNGSNSPTVTPLLNKALLTAIGTTAMNSWPFQDGTPPQNITNGYTITLNWARTARVKTVGFCDATVDDGDAATEEVNIGTSDKTRYSAIAFYQRTNDPSNATIRWVAEA